MSSSCPAPLEDYWLTYFLVLFLFAIRYITPVTTRTRISQLLNDESLMRWWLPNDEGFTPLLQTVRAIADERNAVAAAAQQENMKQIHRALSRMNLGHDKTGDRE